MHAVNAGKYKAKAELVYDKDKYSLINVNFSTSLTWEISPELIRVQIDDNIVKYGETEQLLTYTKLSGNIYQNLVPLLLLDTGYDKVKSTGPFKAAVVFKIILYVFKLAVHQLYQTTKFAVIKTVLDIYIAFFFVARLDPSYISLDFINQKLFAVFQRIIFIIITESITKRMDSYIF